MQRFTDLRVWQAAYSLALDLYQRTRGYPEAERYGLVTQTRRAAVSVCANVAEGSKRKSRPDYARMLNIAEGSASEVECLIMFARDLEYIDRESASALLDRADHVGRMLAKLRGEVERHARSR